MASAQFTVEVNWERVQGKFATREEITEMVQEELDSAMSSLDLSGLGADGNSEYEITDYSVEESTPVKQPKAKKGTPEQRAEQRAEELEAEVQRLTTERNQLRNQLNAIAGRELRI